VPGYAYPDWGIEGDESWLREESDRQYEIEWKGGSKKQMEYVVEAITESGLGNYSQMLRDANAELVSKAAQKSKKNVNYMELGAGISTVNVYQRLQKDNIDSERLIGTLIEPSKDRLESAAAELEKMGLKRGKNFRIIVGRDNDIPSFIEPNSQDITSYVGVVHHHAYLDAPLRHVYKSLKKNGLLIVGDWHNAMWEHPNRVYEFLKDEFEWPTKEQDMEAFVRAYPKALEKAPELSELDAASNRHIKRFWRAWEKVRKREKDASVFRPEDDIFMLEAHRPVERQNEVIEQIGFRLDTHAITELQNPNPRMLVPDAGILYVTAVQK
jgi:SAM-dependent methyltransferase